MSNLTVTTTETETPKTPMGRIRAMVLKHCSRDRQERLEPILLKLEANMHVPASTSKSRHGAFPGGLAYHTHIVMKLAMGMGKEALAIIDESRMSLQEAGGGIKDGVTACLNGESIVTASLLHDLNKIQRLDGGQFYVPNVLKGGKVSEAKPWMVNEDCSDFGDLLSNQGGASTIPAHLRILLEHPSIQYPSGLTSLAVAEKWSPGLVQTLSTEEVQSIVWHEGIYSKGDGSGFRNNESLLWIVTHAADFAAAISGI